MRRIGKVIIRYIYRYPLLLKVPYEVYKRIIIYCPFLSVTYKWFLIRKERFQFEVERNRYQKGKSKLKNILFGIKYRIADNISDYSKKRKSIGFYSIEVSYKGLIIEGKLNCGKSGKISLTVDGLVLREEKKKKGEKLFFRIRKSVLEKFPEKVTLRVITEYGDRLIYRTSDTAQIEFPGGDCSLSLIIGDGFSLSKKGGIPDSREKLDVRYNLYLDLYKKVNDFFEKELGIPLFVMYGTLLGFVRSNDFILNDDDFDAGYISFKNNSKEVKEETLEIIIKLIEAGFIIGMNALGRLFTVSMNSGVHIDVCPLWMDGKEMIAYKGLHIPTQPADFLPVQEKYMRNIKISVPKNSELFLESYYGKTWRTPDPGYVQKTSRITKADGKKWRDMCLSPHEYLKFQKKITKSNKEKHLVGQFRCAAFRDHD